MANKNGRRDLEKELFWRQTMERPQSDGKLPNRNSHSAWYNKWGQIRAVCVCAGIACATLWKTAR
jgi:hypothetical protein